LVLTANPTGMKKALLYKHLEEKGSAVDKQTMENRDKYSTF